MRASLLGVAVLLTVSGCGGTVGFDAGPQQTQDRTISAVSAVDRHTGGATVHSRIEGSGTVTEG